MKLGNILQNCPARYGIFNDIIKNLMIGENQEISIADQNNPVDNDSTTPDPIALYTTNGDGNKFCELMPKSFDGSAWATTQYSGLFQEYYSNQQTMTEITTKIFQTPDKGIISGTGTYARTYYSAGVDISSDLASEAYYNGKATFTTSHTGETLTWDGFYLGQSLTKIYNGKIRNFTHDSTDQNFLLLHIDDPCFEDWTSSSVLAGWTKNGAGLTLTREASDYQGTYHANLQSSGTGTSDYLSQTIAVSPNVSECTFVVWLKHNASSSNAKIGVCMDGANWTYTTYTSDTYRNGKYVCLYVNSLVNSTASIIVGIWPQTATNNTGNIDVEACMLHVGGFDA